MGFVSTNNSRARTTPTRDMKRIKIQRGEKKVNPRISSLFYIPVVSYIHIILQILHNKLQRETERERERERERRKHEEHERGRKKNSIWRKFPDSYAIPI